MKKPASRRACAKNAFRTGENNNPLSITPAQQGLYNLLGEKRIEFIEKRHPRLKMLHAFFWVMASISFCVHIILLAIMAIRFLSVSVPPPQKPRIIMRFNFEKRTTENVGLQTDKPEIDRAALEHEMAELFREGVEKSRTDKTRSGGETNKPDSEPREERMGDYLKFPSEFDPSDFAASFGKPRNRQPADSRKRSPQAADVEKIHKEAPDNKPIENVDRQPVDTMGLSGPEKKQLVDPPESGNEQNEESSVYDESLPRPKTLSFSEWCKELAQTPVHGLGGGTAKPVVPNSGSPEFFGAPLSIVGDSVIFVIDRSASMILESKPFFDLDGKRVRGTKLDRAKVELKRAIAALSEKTKFNIIFFSQFNRKWRRSPVFASPVEKDTAFKFIATIRHGEQTDTSGAVIEALTAQGNRHIVLLSDGWPNILGDDTSPGDKSKKHLARVRKANIDRVRVDTFGFGVDNRGRKFLVTLASENEGIYTEIEAMEDE